MEKNIQKLPGYNVIEYKLVLVPHAELARQIVKVREDFTTKFKVENSIKSTPQIVLASFMQIHAAEERIIRRLEVIAMGSKAFKVEVKDYGSYPTHTIFLNVTSKLPISELVKKIRHETQRLMKLDAENKPHFMNDSHFTLAIKLKPWQYEKGWLEYSQKHFTGRFIAKRMLLLKRREGELKFSPAAEFEFMNLPVDIKQGELF